MVRNALSDMEAVTAMPGLEELTEPTPEPDGVDPQEPAHRVGSADGLVVESPADVGHCPNGDQGLTAGA